jgi:hypothetical protein
MSLLTPPSSENTFKEAKKRTEREHRKPYKSVPKKTVLYNGNSAIELHCTFSQHKQQYQISKKPCPS